MESLAFNHKLLDITLRLRILPTQSAFAHDVIKQGARHNEGGAERIEILIAAIARDQPVIRIKHDKAIGHGLKRVFKRPPRPGTFILNALPLPQANNQRASHKQNHQPKSTRDQKRPAAISVPAA